MDFFHFFFRVDNTYIRFFQEKPRLYGDLYFGEFLYIFTMYAIINHIK